MSKPRQGRSLIREFGGCKPHEHKNDHFVAPLRKKSLKHGDTSLAIGACLGHTLVKRQGRKQANEHEDKRSQRREDSSASRAERSAVL